MAKLSEEIRGAKGLLAEQAVPIEDQLAKLSREVPDEECQKRYGPVCFGTIKQHNPRGWRWWLRCLIYETGEVRPLIGDHNRLELVAAGSGVDEADARARCDQQAADWQRRFPMLNIVEGGTP